MHRILSLAPSQAPFSHRNFHVPPIVSICDLHKSYADGSEALKGVSLDIEEGEIIALLGPNGAGKTTLISTVCGISYASNGVSVGGFDIFKDYRKTRAMIGLIPQEITLESFQRVEDSLHFSRGLFNKPRDEALVELLLKKLSLWDKRDARNITLSGGMRRRVMIGKALSHQPRIPVSG